MRNDGLKPSLDIKTFFNILPIIRFLCESVRIYVVSFLYIIPLLENGIIISSSRNELKGCVLFLSCVFSDKTT